MLRSLQFEFESDNIQDYKMLQTCTKALHSSVSNLLATKNN